MPAIIYQSGERIRAEAVNPGDRVFVNCARRAGSVHCGVTRVSHEKGKVTIYFKEFGNGGTEGTHRDEGISSLHLYPME